MVISNIILSLIRKVSGGATSTRNYPDVSGPEVHVPRVGKHQWRGVVQTQSQLHPENVKTQGGKSFLCLKNLMSILLLTYS